MQQRPGFSAGALFMGISGSNFSLSLRLRPQAAKAPLPKGGWQKSLIFDWGIVFFCNPSVQNLLILDTSPYTGEARASRSIRTLNSNFCLTFFFQFRKIGLSFYKGSTL